MHSARKETYFFINHFYPKNNIKMFHAKNIKMVILWKRIMRKAFKTFIVIIHYGKGKFMESSKLQIIYIHYPKDI